MCIRDRLLCGSKVLVLSKREGALLEFLLRNPGQTLPRLTILSRVWGPNAEVEAVSYTHLDVYKRQAYIRQCHKRRIRCIVTCPHSHFRHNPLHR